MAYTNDISALLNKIENRLGLQQLANVLPDNYKKEKWADIIKDDTLLTFSRYFNNKIRIYIDDNSTVKKNDVYIIKEEAIGGARLLGVGDIDFNSIAKSGLVTNLYNQVPFVNNQYSFMYGSGTNSFSPLANMESAIGSALMADATSMYRMGVYPEFVPPNGFILRGRGNTTYPLYDFAMTIFISHESLATISPTKMEIFEELATADIAGYLYNNLKYYEGIDTVYAQIDLKLSDLQNIADKRKDIIDELNNSYVTAANDAVPYIITI